MIIFLLLSLAFFVVYKASIIPIIHYNKTYTYNVHSVSPDPPSYIKIIDDTHYIAIPNLELKDDYNQGFSIILIQGRYRESHNIFVLGKNITKTNLWFNSYDDFKAGKYSKTSNTKRTITKVELPFEEGLLKKRKGTFYYKSWKINTYLRKKRPVLMKLKKSKINLPTTEKEFIQRYHKKQAHQQEYFCVII